MKLALWGRAIHLSKGGKVPTVPGTGYHFRICFRHVLSFSPKMGDRAHGYGRQHNCGNQHVRPNRVVSSMQRDYSSGQPITVKKVDYGQELYERAVQNLEKQMKLNGHLRGTEKKGEHNHHEKHKKKEDKGTGKDECRDFSKPQFNSSARVTDELAKALEQLKLLPKEMERIFMNDNRFEPIVLEKATKALNAPREKKIYKDLVSVEHNNEKKAGVRRSIEDQIKAVKPPSRIKDPEPNLLDYQDVTFSRIKPKQIPPPPRPTQGVGVDIPIWRQYTEYQMINGQKKWEDDADKWD